MALFYMCFTLNHRLFYTKKNSLAKEQKEKTNI